MATRFDPESSDRSFELDRQLERNAEREPRSVRRFINEAVAAFDRTQVPSCSCCVSGSVDATHEVTLSQYRHSVEQAKAERLAGARGGK